MIQLSNRIVPDDLYTKGPILNVKHVKESLQDFKDMLEDEDCKLSYPEIMKKVFGDALCVEGEQ